MATTQVFTSSIARLPKEQFHEFFYTVLQVLGASFFIALCAQISLPLYFTPVPLSGQTFGVMLVGAVLGRYKGVLSVFAYLLEGGFGFPVFACYGSGLATLIGLKGGYLFAFIMQAYIAGIAFENHRSNLSSTLLLLLSCAVQLGVGAAWLSLYIGQASAVALGVTPFVLGEILKVLAIGAYTRTRSKA